MKKILSSICILILSNVARAADLGLDVNSLGKYTQQNGVVAREGTGTCRVAGRESKRQPTIMDLTIGELRTKLQKSSSTQQKQEILDLVEKALVDENYIQK